MRKINCCFSEYFDTNEKINGVIFFDTSDSAIANSLRNIKIISDSDVSGVSIKINGKVEAKILLELHGDNQTLEVGGSVGGAFSIKMWSDAKLVLSERCTSNETQIWVQEHGEVNIGANCMLAHEVLILCGDMHAIFDFDSGEQINLGNPKITINNHVWVGRKVTILKDVNIGCGAIVGTGSLVNKDVPSKCAVAGVPAKVIKSGVSWTRSRVASGDDIRKTKNYIESSINCDK